METVLHEDMVQNYFARMQIRFSNKNMSRRKERKSFWFFFFSGWLHIELKSVRQKDKY